MKKNILRKTFPSLMGAGAILVGAQTLTAGSLPANYEFGTDAGRVSITDAGFNAIQDSGSIFEMVPTALRVNILGSNFTSYGFVQEFDGLGGGNSNDFRIQTKIQLVDSSSSNNRRMGVTILGDFDLDNEGIFVGVIGNNDLGQRDLVIRNGLNSKDIARAPIMVGGYEPGQEYLVDVQGAYSGDELTITATITNGPNVATATATVSASQYNGTLFGGSGRLRKGYVVDYVDFKASRN